MTLETNAVNKSILLIDDEAVLRNSLLNSLKQNGYEVDDATTAIEALKLIEKKNSEGKQYSYVVSDINLPDITGTKLVKIIKSKYRNLPIILTSGCKKVYTEEMIKEAWANGYIAKPYSADHLMDKMNGIKHEDIQDEVLNSMNKNEVISAYAFIRFDENTNFNEVYEKLYKLENVVRCDAVRENYDLAIKFNAKTKEEAEGFIKSKINALEGIKSVDYVETIKPEIDKDISNMILSYETARGAMGMVEDLADKVSSYVFIEIEENKFNTIYPQLYFMDEVLDIDVTAKKCDLIIQISGNNFNHLDKIVRNKIWPIDGMIRARKLNIIEMFEM